MRNILDKIMCISALTAGVIASLTSLLGRQQSPKGVLHKHSSFWEDAPVAVPAGIGRAGNPSRHTLAAPILPPHKNSNLFQLTKTAAEHRFY